MTAQPPTKQDTADFAAQLRQLLTNSSDESNQSINATTANTNNNCFNSEDFQKFLNENRDTVNSSSSLDQIFKTSEFFKNQQSFSELFKSQQSFSQMFQSKDSFKELFQSLDSDQKKAIFSDSKDPLSPPAPTFLLAPRCIRAAPPRLLSSRCGASSSVVRRNE